MFIEQGIHAVHIRTTGGYLLIGLLIAGVFLIDLTVPNGVAVPMLYVLPLALTAWTRTRAVVVAAAGACLGLTFLGYVLSSSSELVFPGSYNRALSMIVLAGCAYMALVSQGQRRKIMEAYDERCRGEEEFKQLGVCLEQRVEERTAELHAARLASLNILDDTECVRQRAEQAEAEVMASHAALEQRVEKRTAELAQANAQLERTGIERRDAEERFRLVVEGTSNGIIMVNQAGVILLVNVQIEMMFGYSRSELLGQPAECLVPVRFRKQYPGHCEGVFSAPTQRLMGTDQELCGLRKDGSEFPLEIGLNPIETVDGVMVMASIIDITERKRIEEQFKVVVESAPFGLVMVDESGAMLLVNPELEKQFGYSQRELLGQPIELLVPERFRHRDPAHRQSFHRALTSRAAGEERDLYGLRKDGSEFPAEIALNPIDSSFGLRTLAIVVDISERKRVERQSRLSEFAVDHSSVATFWITPDGKVFRVNQAALNILGYSEEELLRMTVPDFNPAYSVDTWTAHWQELKEKQHITYESSLRHKEGHVFLVEIRNNFLTFEGQEYNVKFVADIADRKRAEEYGEQQRVELGRSNSELEQFAYVASHDLQEPLRMVSSYCGLLARRYKGKLGGDADEYIHFAVDGAMRMRCLIDDLLLYSRVGRRDKPFAPINSIDSVRGALANLGMAIENAHAVITCDPLPTVLADPSQLTQVFQNLIGNALKFRGGQDSRIRVSARCLSETNDPSQWVFSVQDNGMGFEQQFDDRVFVIFQRLHTKEEYPGSGMGLAITKKIIERHGGRIWVESTPGVGTTFFFTLRGQPSDSPCVELSGVGISK